MLRVAQHDNSVEHVSLLVFFSILCELIQRTRSVQDREQLPDTLIALPYLEMTPHTWLLTGELGGTAPKKRDHLWFTGFNCGRVGPGI